MVLVDLIDETFVVCDAEVLAARLHDEELWNTWWPELQLTIFMDRGAAGVRWSISGELFGSSEIWLEPFSDGVIVHYYLRADVPASDEMSGGKRIGERIRGQRAQRWKIHINALKDEIEGGRAPGCPRLVATLD